jgi:hypothetical protein
VILIVKGKPMKQRDRALFLKRKHLHIDQELQREVKHLYPDNLVLAKLKRKKLQLKDELVAVRENLG